MDDITFDLLINVQSYSDDELKDLARKLSEEESEMSKRRRLLHSQIDILRAEMVRRSRDRHSSGESIFGAGDISALTAILSGRSAGGESDDAPKSAEDSAPNSSSSTSSC